MEGFGVAKNFDKAIECLTLACNLGNGQSAFQLFLLYSTVEEKKDVVQAYKYVTKAVTRGVAFFDQMHIFFKEHYAKLAPIFIDLKKPPSELTVENEKEIINMHEAYINEINLTFSGALSKDRMYHRPAGFVTDQQIWMMGVLIKYFVNKVLHFSHRDFMMALRADICPLLGDTGLWMAKQYMVRQTEKGNDEKKKKARVVIELIQNYMDNGFEGLKKESKYNMLNRFSPKKLPNAVQTRTGYILYSWMHYAP
jgi:hypothetical protein